MSKPNEARFGFGKNWKSYSKTITNIEIEEAKTSLTSSLNISNFYGLRILDAGCGSGLFSLAACTLEASEVISFDYDPDSVACTESVHQRFGPYHNWTIGQGDVLDSEFLNSLDSFDIVYSWGVLHHTGNMWQALDNISNLVRPNGLLFISIYNDQGWRSKVWKMIKKLYVISPKIIQYLMAIVWYLVVISVRTTQGITKNKPPQTWFKGSERGMSLWHDVIDWIGGFPFETASVDELEAFLQKRGFTLINLKAKTGSGCNELVLRYKGNPPIQKVKLV